MRERRAGTFRGNVAGATHRSRGSIRGQGAVLPRALVLYEPVADCEGLIVVSRSAVIRCRARLETLKIDDDWRGASQCAAGCCLSGTLSALASGVGLTTPVGWLFYLVMPPLGVGFLVAYMLLRHGPSRSLADAVESVLQELPSVETGSLRRISGTLGGPVSSSRRCTTRARR